MFFLGETKNGSTSFPKDSIDASTHAKVPCLGWTVVASQGHQKLLSSLVLTETSFFLWRTTTTHPSIHIVPVGIGSVIPAMQLNGFLLESVHSPSCELAIVTLRHRYGSRCFADLSSVAVARSHCPVTAPPTNHRNSQAEKAGW